LEVKPKALFTACNQMTNSANMKSSRKPRLRRKRANANLRNVPASVTVYTGPIKMPTADTTSIVLRDNAAITTAAGGTIGATFNNNPSSARNWTEYSTSWVEYRVLGIRYTYFPIANAPSTTLLGFSGYNSINHGTITSPTTLAEASSTGDSRGWNAFRNFVREWRMATPAESLFQPCSVPSAISDTLMLFASGGGVTLTYGDILVEYLVQFKTHAK
jgi:hypothetical protein